MNAFLPEPSGMPGSRYECKYVVGEESVPALRAFIRPFVGPDRFTRGRDGHRYPICSLYLDTPDLELFRQSLSGERNRFKLRIRSYSDDADDPVYVEIKRRVDGVVRKRRTVLPREDMCSFLASHVHPGTGPRCPALEEFSFLARAGRTKPVMRVKYLREAYESTAGDSVRITFDTRLCHLLTPDHDLRHEDPGWTRTPMGGTILEIKFTDRYPAWVEELVRSFELQRRSVSKYVLSMQRALEQRRLHPQNRCAVRLHG